MKHLLALFLILMLSKLGFIRPWMRRKVRRGDYFYGNRATVRDFFLSLIPQNELQLNGLVTSVIAIIDFSVSFPFTRLMKAYVGLGEKLILILFFLMFIFQCLCLVWQILRSDLYFKTQTTALVFGVLANLSMFVAAQGRGDSFHISQIPFFLILWTYVLSVSSWRARVAYFPLRTSRVMRPKGFPPRVAGRYRILLVNPCSGFESSPFSERNLGYPAILPMVAATVPENWDVMILDEVQDEIDFDLDVDVVGITTMAFFGRNTKKIAVEFKKRGKTIIFGGPDVSENQDYYIGIGDSVLVGEAFDFFPKILADWVNGRLEKKYINHKSHTLAGLPLPRLDLLPLRRYLNLHNILVSTSCPFACEFCTYAKERAVRVRPVQELIAAIRHTPAKQFWFEAPELLAYKPYIRQLETGLKGLGIHWSTHGSMKSCSDPENLRAARAAGLRQVYLGVESFSQEALRFVNKRANTVHEYLSTFKLLDKNGISVTAHIMFGLPQETAADRLLGLDILNRGKVATVLFHFLGVYPGNEAFEEKLKVSGAEEVTVYKKLNEKEGLHFRYYRPKLVSDIEFSDECERFVKSFYSFRSICQRILLRSFGNAPNLLSDLIYNLILKFEAESGYGVKMNTLDHYDLLFRLPKGSSRQFAKEIAKKENHLCKTIEFNLRL